MFPKCSFEHPLLLLGNNCGPAVVLYYLWFISWGYEKEKILNSCCVYDW